MKPIGDVATCLGNLFLRVLFRLVGLLFILLLAVWLKENLFPLSYLLPTVLLFSSVSIEFSERLTLSSPFLFLSGDSADVESIDFF